MIVSYLGNSSLTEKFKKVNNLDINVFSKLKDVYKHSDLLVMIGYGGILTKRQIGRFPMGVINLHTSMLPAYRGRHPLRWAMLDGQSTVGITVHYVDKGIDTGDIILQEKIVVESYEGYNSVLERLLRIGNDLLIAAILQIENDCIYRKVQPQKDNEYLYTTRRTEKDNVVYVDPKTLRQIRALEGLNIKYEIKEQDQVSKRIL